MDKSIYTLGVRDKASAKAVSRFIRDSVRDGGKSGLVIDDPSTVTASGGASDEQAYPPVALASGDVSSISQAHLVDIVTGKQITNVPTLIPVLSMNPATITGKCLVFYGTTKWIAVLQDGVV